MRISVRHNAAKYKTYRAARVRSMFNAPEKADFSVDVDLPLDLAEWDGWKVGMVVGPSGSGKTSVGRLFWGGGAFYEMNEGWPEDKPIIDGICPDGDFDAVTGALAGVGLGEVRAWLRPYSALSNGEKFRASLARVMSERPERVVIDEFTSVVDRQIARMGALAFSKGWRRTGGQVVLLSCHYDVIDWVEPDWVLDLREGSFHGDPGRSLWRRPPFDLEVWQTDWRYWRIFEPYHYLTLPNMVAATNYVGTVDGELVCHVAVSTWPGMRQARACRLVVMPEWQGAGVGVRFLNAVCEMWLRGENRYGKRMPTLFHTSHPGLVAALRRSKPAWEQVSAMMVGGNKAKSAATLARWTAKSGKHPSTGGYGGHYRGVQGFRYVGDGGGK